MKETLSLFSLGAAAFFTGVAFTVKAFFSIAEQHSGDASESCLGNFIMTCAFSIALFFFYLFLTSL